MIRIVNVASLSSSSSSSSSQSCDGHTCYFWSLSQSWLKVCFDFQSISRFSESGTLNDCFIFLDILFLISHLHCPSQSVVFLYYYDIAVFFRLLSCWFHFPAWYFVSPRFLDSVSGELNSLCDSIAHIPFSFQFVVLIEVGLHGCVGRSSGMPLKGGLTNPWLTL